MSYGLEDSDWEAINSVLSKNPKVERAILFGSRAMGTNRKFSDVDLTLCGDELTHQDLVTIYTEIDDLLLPFIMDLSLYRSLKNENLLEHIKRCGVVVYRKSL